MRCWRGIAQCWMMNAFVECIRVAVLACRRFVHSPRDSRRSSRQCLRLPLPRARHSYNYIKAPVNKTLQRAAAAARGLLGGEGRAQDRQGLSK